MRQFFSFAFLSAISYLCHRVFDKSKWNTKDTAFKVDKSLPRLLPYAVCQIVRFDWNFCIQKHLAAVNFRFYTEGRKISNMQKKCVNLAGKAYRPEIPVPCHSSLKRPNTAFPHKTVHPTKSTRTPGRETIRNTAGRIKNGVPR